MSSTTPETVRTATLTGGTYPLGGEIPPGRGYVLTSAGDPSGTSPSAGGDIDGVAVEVTVKGVTSDGGIPATKGVPFQGEAGGSITDGDDLEADGDGRFATTSGGTVVARALEGASSGSFFWAGFVGSRTADRMMDGP